MKRYLYFFEAGEVRVSSDVPTDEDLLCVAHGYLDVIDMQEGTRVDGSGHWTEIEEAKIATNTVTKNDYHTY